MSDQVSTRSGQVKSDLAVTVHNNLVLGQVMTMSEHMWSGQCLVTRGHVRSYQVIGQDQVRSGKYRTCQFSTMSGRSNSKSGSSWQVSSGQVRSGQGKVSMNVMSGMPGMRIIPDMPYISGKNSWNDRNTKNV